MNLTKLLESRVGNHGIKFNPVLALEAKLQLAEDIAVKLDLPRNDVKALLYLAKEQQLEQAIERLATTWRWWGDSLGYFNRKSDAHTFYQEAKLALSHGLIWLSLQQWQNTGLFSVHGIHGDSTELFYIDPETHAAKIVPDTYTYPVIHGLAYDDSALPTEVYVRLLPDNEGANAQLIKLATIVTDISLSMASYPSAEIAVATDEARPLRLHILTDTDLTPLATTAQITSAELAAALPEFPSHQPSTVSDDKYLEFLVRKFGLHNQSIEVVSAETVPYLNSFDATASVNVEVPARKQTPAKTPVVVETVKSEPIAPVTPTEQAREIEPTVITPEPQPFLSTSAAEVAERIAEEILSVEDPILDLPEPAPRIPATKPSLPIQPATIPTPPVNLAPATAARDIVHKVKVANTEIVIASKWQDAKPLEVHAVVYKSPVGFQGEVNTLNKLINLHLTAGRSVFDLVEILSGESFGPAGNTDNPDIPTCTSVADYIGQWLTQQHA
jgi:hypothetical protein